MSIYSTNYKKTLDGYNKILNTINSVITPEQLECIPNMFVGWVDLMDKWCDEVYYDKTNRNRKKDADRLGDSGKEMFDTLCTLYQQRMQDLSPVEYEGAFTPTRVKTMQEMSHDNDEYNEDE